jgi:phosphatidylglycerol lysyltransferase
MPDLPRARALVLRYGWNATSYQVVNPGIEHWFSTRGDAVVGFVRRHGVRVVAGAPICAKARLAEVVSEWERAAAQAGDRVCYFGAAGRVKSLLENRPGYATVLLGAQPVWQPAQWPRIIARHASLRAQLYRARNKGVEVCEWSPERATAHPALQRCLEEWLETRGLPPLHFLVEPQTLAYLEDRRIFVARQSGRVVGFVVASPVPVRNGWLTEQFVRARNAPNGTIELLLDHAVRAMAAGGAEYVTMGLVPLSRRTWLPADYNPLWLRLVLTWIRAHGRRFYNFDGLEAFKAKFQPRAWEPIFAISNEPRFSPHTLYAIAAAFSDGSPITAVTGGLLKALRQELRWLIRGQSSSRSSLGNRRRGNA